MIHRFTINKSGMLNKIRSLNFGWMLILLGIGFVVSGLSMIGGETKRTLLCFDDGCIYIQSLSGLGLGLLTMAVGIYKILRK